ncbi:Huntingtin-interacting protein 1 [Halotydeus destructor]|nr:Huntingtin-interacting protein 1 [Halotydeus destructor]
MATRQVQKVLSHRTNSLEQERENFAKNQFVSINKAINNQECPVKEKHVRRILIGTYQEKSASTFWSIGRRLPIDGNPIVCWKFCHVLHKVLREGHKKSIADSYPYRSRILDVGKHWGLLKEGYGKLIHNYCTLLVNKIEFHVSNPRFPGDLKVTDAELDRIGESDVNVFFQCVCEMFDYLDEILVLQASVFGSLDMSRANSMTNSGQCRLAPLISCIQDSSFLYDYCVKVLFKLHAVLPAGTLDGHRSRFYSQFKILKQFYLNARNLQYFKPLIKIPPLPDNPPNFLRQAELQSHVTPVVIVPQQSDSPDGMDFTDTLVDLSYPQYSAPSETHSDDTSSQFSFQTEQHNGFLSVLEDKNRLINALNARIEDFQLELEHMKVETARTIDGLKRSSSEMESNSKEQHRVIDTLKMEKENQLKELEDLKQELERHKAGTDMQTELAKAEAKFVKMKEAYAKLRVEHIELLRGKAEQDKQMVAARSKLAESENLISEAKEKLKSIKTLEDQASSSASKVSELSHKLESVEVLNKKLLTEMAQLQQEKVKAEQNLSDNIGEIGVLKKVLSDGEKAASDQLLARGRHFLEIVLKETQSITRKTGDEVDNALANLNCTPEYFFLQCNVLSDHLSNLIKYCPGVNSQQPPVDELIASEIQYSHQLCFLLNCAKVIDQTLPNIELGQELMMRCKELGKLSIDLSGNMVAKETTSETLLMMNNCLNEIISLRRRILPELSVDLTKDIGALLEQELTDMTVAIQDAADRIEQMMITAKTKDTGVKLEVNGKILESCTTLMQAIIHLINDSKHLQEEIKSRKQGSSNAKEFYQRNHRWTEGLISAAKVVGFAAKLLVDAADKVVSGTAKFEELMAASQEIAAATAQLVVASRVQADGQSEKLAKLSSSSKKVTEATGNVVATAKSCSQLVEDKDVLDFSKLTLHQAKKLEMESKIRELELEAALTKEREKLARLRKLHYHLSDSSN